MICLDWPWSKLTNNVDLNDELVEKIGQQSDDQAAGLSIRELERIRDENLVGIMQTLKGGHGGKGAVTLGANPGGQPRPAT